MFYTTIITMSFCSFQSQWIKNQFLQLIMFQLAPLFRSQGLLMHPTWVHFREQWNYPLSPLATTLIPHLQLNVCKSLLTCWTQIKGDDVLAFNITILSRVSYVSILWYLAMKNLLAILLSFPLPSLVEMTYSIFDC